MNSFIQNIENAFNIAFEYGQVDGAHHKMWVIAQMVRALCGNEERYKEWVSRYEISENEDDRYTWDVGIAP